MIPTKANGLRALCTVALALACAPANGSKQTDSRTTTRTDTATVPAALAQPADSDAVRADLARIQGSPTAPVWVIEVSDFQCPYCKQWHDQTYKKLRDEFVNTGKVRLAYVNFPLAQHAHAGPAAEGAMCASAQGKFWEMHDALFTTQENGLRPLLPPAIRALARRRCRPPLGRHASSRKKAVDQAGSRSRREGRCGSTRSHDRRPDPGRRSTDRESAQRDRFRTGQNQKDDSLAPGTKKTP